MNWPSVSIGIPTWNRASLVIQAVRSVMQQDYPVPVEIVVADDGSTDDTLLNLRRFGDRVKVLHGEHKGIASAKNRALLGCTGEIRGILDSDDWYDPRFVSRCVETLLENPEAGLVYTDNYEADGRGLVKLTPALDWSLEGFLDTCNLRGDCWLAWWSILRETDLHDERFELEVDYDLYYQMAEITDFKRVPKPLHFVRFHHGRVTKNRQKAAFWHAAGLGKHGHPISYALQRAERTGRLELWKETIEKGYEHGVGLRKPAPVPV